MTPKECAIAAFELRLPDDIVPTFELQFQLSEDLLGKSHFTMPSIDDATGAE